MFLTRLLKAAVGALPRQQQLAVALFCVAGYRLAEVAQVMNISEGTVKQHLSRARAKLRGALEDER
jgi:RNA polymerase sigma-70 factor (ECF subfamily)